MIRMHCNIKHLAGQKVDLDGVIVAIDKDGFANVPPAVAAVLGRSQRWRNLSEKVAPAAPAAPVAPVASAPAPAKSSKNDSKPGSVPGKGV